MKYAIYVKGERGLTCLRALVDKKLMPTVCISENDKPVVIDFCQTYDIPCFIEDKPKNESHIAQMQTYNLDLLVCAGYSKILPTALFEDLPHGGINCHGGKLPEYRGASPLPWQIINGETEGAAYILKLSGGIDDGPIYAFEKYTIEPHDTARDVTNKVLAIFNKHMPNVVAAFNDGKTPPTTQQSDKNVCHWTRRYPKDGLIDWDKLNCQQVLNLIRALTDPYPGAFFTHDGKEIIINQARAHHTLMAGVPGRVVGRTQKGFLVLANDGAIEVLEVIIDGVTRSASDYVINYGKDLNS